MIRLFGIVVGFALIGYPPFLIYAISVPVPRFRTGTYVDFLTFTGTIVGVYGGVLLGIVVLWARVGRVWQRLRPVAVWQSGVWGALAVSVLFVVGAGVRGLATQGSFEKGIGNLWGLLLILPAVFGALVSGGVALLFNGVRPPAEAGRPVPGRGPAR